MNINLFHFIEIFFIMLKPAFFENRKIDQIERWEWKDKLEDGKSFFESSKFHSHMCIFVL